MAIDARNIINSPLGLNIAYMLGKFTPYWLGYRIAAVVARRIASQANWMLVKATRCNQWVIHGRNMDSSALDKHVSDNFQEMAISIFDFYHTINNPKASMRLIEPHPFAQQFVQRPEFSDRGVVVAGVHMSNFDMAFQLGGLAGVKAMSLTLPDFNAAYQKQYEMRRKSGMNVVPASIGSIKHAVEHLQAGGAVITAVDRPDEGSSYRPNFFGLPASLPVHYIFLALKAHVPVIVAAVFKKPDGKYHFRFSDPIEMQPHPDRQQEILINAENILHVAEGYIRQNPSQWSMTFPVWPEALVQVPG